MPKGLWTVPRPKKPAGSRVHLRLSLYLPSDMYAWIAREAGLRGACKTQVVRDLVREAMDGSARAVARDGDARVSLGVSAVTARIGAPFPEDLP